MIVHVQWIQWGERTMNLRGSHSHTNDLVTITVAYAHVSASALVQDGGSVWLRFVVGTTQFEMFFQDSSNARDVAGELARRMESANG